MVSSYQMIMSHEVDGIKRDVQVPWKLAEQNGRNAGCRKGRSVTLKHCYDLVTFLLLGDVTVLPGSWSVGIMQYRDEAMHECRQHEHGLALRCRVFSSSL